MRTVPLQNRLTAAALVRSRQAWIRQVLWLGLTATCLVLGVSSLAIGQETPAAEPPAQPEVQPIADAGDESLIADGADAAWEFRPYRVLVWVCSDGSTEIEANYQRIVDGFVARSELIDFNGWELTVEKATGKWRQAFLQNLRQTEKLDALKEDEHVLSFDKLMAVCLVAEGGVYQARVREFDVQTQQWGPLQFETLHEMSSAPKLVANAIKRAFMPIARIDRVSESDDVFVRFRGMKASVIARLNEEWQWVVEPNVDSPIFVKPTDRLLPIIRNTDRNGQLIKLAPIDFTYLTIEEQTDAQAVCAIQSVARAPLANRTSKRKQKLAVVIRPPEISTTLKLVSRDDGSPMEGIEIWTVGPRRRGEPRPTIEDFTLMGKSDWRGEFQIPPSDEGLRLVYLRRGRRNLMKLPIIPGYFEEQTAEVLNDETRLFAEGIITGISKEILNLVAQREIYESEIESHLEKEELSEARQVLTRYQELPSAQDIKNRLGDEETRLKGRTKNQRELDYISGMFRTLREILNSKIAVTNEPELRAKIQSTTVNPGG